MRHQFPPKLTASGASVSDPGVAYIRTDGNDDTGNGSPGKPYRHPNAAVLAGFKTLDLGVGSFNAITQAVSGGLLYLRGRGQTMTILSGISCSAYLAIFDLGLRTVSIGGVAGGNGGVGLVGAFVSGGVTTTGGASLTIEAGSYVGGAADVSDGNTTSGGITIDNSYVDSAISGESGTITVRRSAELLNLGTYATLNVNAGIIASTFYANSYP